MSEEVRIDPEVLLAETRWVRELALRLVRDPESAEDLAQETMVVALGWRGEAVGARRGWLAGVVRNLARRRTRTACRRRKRERGGAQSEVLPGTGEVVERLATHRMLVEELGRLSEPYRSTLLLRYFEGMPPRRIAAVQGVPVKTVNTRITRGLELLRGRLATLGGGDPEAWRVALAGFGRGLDAPGHSGANSWREVFLKLAGGVAAAFLVTSGVRDDFGSSSRGGDETPEPRGPREVSSLLFPPEHLELGDDHVVVRYEPNSGVRPPLLDPEPRSKFEGAHSDDVGIAALGEPVSSTDRRGPFVQFAGRSHLAQQP